MGRHARSQEFDNVLVVAPQLRVEDDLKHDFGISRAKALLQDRTPRHVAQSFSFHSHRSVTVVQFGAEITALYPALCQAIPRQIGIAVLHGLQHIAVAVIQLDDVPIRRVRAGRYDFRHRHLSGSDGHLRVIFVQ